MSRSESSFLLKYLTFGNGFYDTAKTRVVSEKCQNNENVKRTQLFTVSVTIKKEKNIKNMKYKQI